ncbi:hypothetical protein GCM10027186_21790 [Micromonospora schwarzwaldensis]
MRVWGEAALRLDAAGVLDVPALTAAQVLPEPVEQTREVHGVPRGAAVVVPVGVERGAVGADRAVGVEGERRPHRRPVGGPVRGGVRPADRARLDLAARQFRGVLTPPGGALAARAGVVVALVLIAGGVRRGDPSPEPFGRDGLFHFADRLVEVVDLVPLARPGCLVAGELQVCPEQDQGRLFVGRRLRGR